MISSDDTRPAAGNSASGELKIRGELKIDAELIIHSAASLRQKLLELLAQHPSGDCRIDLSAVEECDAIGLQLLISARKSAENLSSSFVIAAASPAVEEAAAAIGLPLEEVTGKTPAISS